MRLRIILLAVATSSLVLVSFLVPLALVLRTLAADRAVSTAMARSQSLALLVPTAGEHNLSLEVDQINAQGDTQVAIFLPGGDVLGKPGDAGQSPTESSAIRLAQTGRSFSTGVPGGMAILMAVQGLNGGTAVIRTFVPDSVLRHGVTRAWLLLGGVGLFLLLLSIVVADQLARSLVRPLAAVASVSDQLAAGDLSARATEAGPPEVRRAGAGLNRLADRIGELLAHERETVADLSHRLRTPLTALRIDAESVRDSDSALRRALLADVAAVERTVSEIIHEARRPRGSGDVSCDSAQVIAGRAAFWWPLAEDQARRMIVDVEPGPLPVRVSPDDLAACADILLENVFTHTPEGAGLAVRLSRRAGGGAWLVVADDGPGFPDLLGDADPTQRGLSRGGSTGLGLDIARRITQAADGTLTIGRSASGGGSVTLGFGPPSGPPMGNRRHGRVPARLFRRSSLAPRDRGGESGPRVVELTEISGAAAGGHDEDNSAAEKIACLCPGIQPCPPMTGLLAGQHVLTAQPGHVIVKERPPEPGVAEDNLRCDRHVGQSGSSEQAWQLPPDLAVGRGAGESAEDDPGCSRIRMVGKYRFLVEFQHPYPAFGPGYASHLRNDARRVRDMLQDRGGPAGVEHLVVKGQFGSVAESQRNPRAEVLCAPPRLSQHLLTGVDTRHPGAVWHEAHHLGHVPAGSASDIQCGACPPERKLLGQSLLGRPQSRNRAGFIEKPDQPAWFGGRVDGAEFRGIHSAILRDHLQAAFPCASAGLRSGIRTMRQRRRCWLSRESGMVKPYLIRWRGGVELDARPGQGGDREAGPGTPGLVRLRQPGNAGTAAQHRL